VTPHKCLTVGGMDGVVATIVGFLEEIGVPLRFVTASPGGTMPGVAMVRGALVIDLAGLEHPGDLLHEAGHFALLAPDERAGVEPGDQLDNGDEMGAIAWSWAALVHLGLDPAVVFHDAGYLGGATSIIENFTAGRFFGVPILQWRGLTSDTAPFPHMSAWLRT
jgi:hypothetical protein